MRMLYSILTIKHLVKWIFIVSEAKVYIRKLFQRCEHKLPLKPG